MTFEKWKIYEVKTKAESETPAGDRASGGGLGGKSGIRVEIWD